MANNYITEQLQQQKLRVELEKLIKEYGAEEVIDVLKNMLFR